MWGHAANLGSRPPARRRRLLFLPFLRPHVEHFHGLPVRGEDPRNELPSSISPFHLLLQPPPLARSPLPPHPALTSQRALTANLLWPQDSFASKRLCNWGTRPRISRDVSSFSLPKKPRSVYWRCASSSASIASRSAR
eukprot:3224461-Prymnesium_polylepis.3